MKPLTKLPVPGEIIFLNILPRLPYKSMMRFRSVSKSWYFSMHETMSIRLRKTVPRNHLCLLIICIEWLNGSRPAIQFLSAPIPAESGNYMGPSGLPITHLLKGLENIHPVHVQCLNGLICFYKYPAYTGVPVHILDPTIPKLITLPHEPMLSTMEMGYHLGCDPFQEDHKVLRISLYECENGRGRLIYDIFKLGTDNSWRNIAIRPFGEMVYRLMVPKSLREGVCVSGIIYMMHPSWDYLVAFDVSKEEFRMIPNPQAEWKRTLCRYYNSTRLLCIDGCLALIGQYSSYKLNMHVLKDYYNQRWVMHEIVLPQEYSMYNYPTCAIHTGEVVLRQRDLENPVWVLCYDKETKCFRRIYIKDLPVKTEDIIFY